MDLISRFRKSRSKRTWYTIRDDILKDFPCVLRRLNMLDMEVFFAVRVSKELGELATLRWATFPKLKTVWFIWDGSYRVHCLLDANHVLTTNTLIAMVTDIKSRSAFYVLFSEELAPRVGNCVMSSFTGINPLYPNQPRPLLSGFRSLEVFV